MHHSTIGLLLPLRWPDARGRGGAWLDPGV